MKMDTWISYASGSLLSYLFLFLIILESVLSSQSDHKSVSQCYDDNSISFVSLYCGANQVIQIERAFHGSHKNPGIPHCGELANDCVQDVTSKYDWTKCEGMHSCVQTLRKMRTPTECDTSNNVPQSDTDRATEGKVDTQQYLQVEYNCILSATEKTEYQKINKILEKRMQVISQSLQTRLMCTNFTIQEKSIMLQNPGYPDSYMTGTDCRCVIQAPENNKVAVIFHNLSLVKRGRHCIDWLLLQSPNYKDSTLVACGLLDGRKRLTESKSNWLLLHFHTAKSKVPDGSSNGKKTMSGFKIQVQSNHVKPLNIKCYTVDPNHIDSIAYRNGQDKSSSNLILPVSEWEVLPSTDKHPLSNAENHAHTNTLSWMNRTAILTLCVFFKKCISV